MAVEVLHNERWYKYPDATSWAVTNDGVLKVKRSNGDSVAFFSNMEWDVVQEADSAEQ